MASPGLTPPACASDHARFGSRLASILHSFETMPITDAPAQLRHGLGALLTVRDSLRDPTPGPTDLTRTLRSASLALAAATNHLDTMAPMYAATIPGALYAIGRLSAFSPGAADDHTITATACISAAASYLRHAGSDQADHRFQRRWLLAYSVLPWESCVSVNAVDPAQHQALGDLFAYLGLASAIRAWDWGDDNDGNDFVHAATRCMSPAERAEIGSADLAQPHTYFADASRWNPSSLAMIEHILAILLDTVLCDGEYTIAPARAVAAAYCAAGAADAFKRDLLGTMEIAAQRQLSPCDLAARLVEAGRSAAAGRERPPASTLLDFLERALGCWSH